MIKYLFIIGFSFSFLSITPKNFAKAEENKQSTQQQNVKIQKEIDALKLEITQLKNKINNSTTNNQNKQIEKTFKQEQQTTQTEGIIGYIPNDTRNKISKWFHTYISPDENPIFLGKRHMIGLTYGYDVDRRWSTLNEISRAQSREMHTLAVGYSSSFKFFCFNGRYTIGLFSWFGYDPKAEGGNFKYRNVGIEFVPEFVFGTKTLYITAGAGVSYIIYGKTSYNSTNRRDNTVHNSEDGVKKDGLTYFNFVVTASIGHRFDNGLAIELLWKHYSNGQLGDVNYDLNFIGMSVRYAFTIGTN